MAESASTLCKSDPSLTRPLKVEAKSPLKWAGSKRQLEDKIIAHVTSVYPDGFDDYYEPFLGSGAIFFALRSRGLIRGTAYLSDTNAELVEMFVAIRDDVEWVLRALRRLAKARDADPEKHYYETRAKDDLSSINSRAARMIYLNKNDFNGLYRVNRQGKFNVPWNRRTAPYVPAEDEIRAASAALQGAVLTAADFRSPLLPLGELNRQQFWYFDPPYIPVTKSADFTAYQKEGFGLEHHEQLALLAGQFNEGGLPFLLSNSDTLASRCLYKGLTVKKVQASRHVNSDATKRGKVSELLVSNKKAK